MKNILWEFMLFRREESSPEVVRSLLGVTRGRSRCKKKVEIEIE